MLRRLAVLFFTAALAIGASAPGAGAASRTMTVESQAWWNKAGIVVPSAVGEHIHVQATVPVTGSIVDGPYSIHVKLTMHHQVAASNTIRWQDGSTTKKTLPYVMGPCEDCTTETDLPVDFSQFGTGLRELRISLNIPDEQPATSGAQRMYQSFGIEVCVRACSPVEQGGRTLKFIEARGWYEGHGYQNARIESGIDSVCSGCTVAVKLAPGSGGKATKYSGVFIDPDMHHGNAGIVVRESNGSFRGNVMLPRLPFGPHKLVLVSSDGQNAGVLAIPFLVT